MIDIHTTQGGGMSPRWQRLAREVSMKFGLDKPVTGASDGAAHARDLDRLILLTINLSTENNLEGFLASRGVEVE